jgi:hypothetical protein
MASCKITIAILVGNKVQSIGEVIAGIKRHRPDVDMLVVRDLSTDATALVATDFAATIACLPFNVGVGGTRPMAFLESLRKGQQAIVLVDPGSQRKPAHVTVREEPSPADAESFEAEASIPKLLVAAGDGKKN